MASLGRSLQFVYPRRTHLNQHLQNNFKRDYMSSSDQKKKVLITCTIPTVASDYIHQRLPSSRYEIEQWPHEDTMSEEELSKKIVDVEGLYCILVNKVKGKVLDNANKLKIVSTMSVGFDHIDVKECTRRGIVVGNTPGVLTETTADLVLALTLATCRRINESAEAVKSGEWGAWKPEWMCGKDLHSSTVGIIGMGNIGRSVARRLHAFNCKILYTGKNEKRDLPSEWKAEYVDMNTLLSTSDFVLPQCPSNDETRGMFSIDAFKKMKPSSVFINTTRGDLVDQEALYEALDKKMILAAGIDVTTPEPLPVDHKLLTLKNLTVLPHVGSATMETRGRMALLAAENLVNGLEGGELRHRVNT
ncbi:glyoxylate reductase/hydroxypyruvate reductase-like [Planoprotostelium fungivorum]|uniref:Glyoxylate reductase/hydroxypyruvate reductase-like n=1 Tax=Planoprotostelium fungivorum TaxID=1890364 RepID=A0A2P6NCW6_9EUKA|nr:glyoxylate reductase/hydroxypyruvate reductase-like [Planoprotostelium fungivorum]